VSDQPHRAAVLFAQDAGVRPKVREPLERWQVKVPVKGANRALAQRELFARADLCGLARAAGPAAAALVALFRAARDDTYV